MIYDKIKEIANDKGISIGKLEKEAGLSNGSISKWNNHNPSTKNLKSVAEVLGVNINKIIS